MKSKVITVYTKDECVQCDRTKIELQKRNLPYTEIDVTKDAEAYAFVQSLGHRSLPVVYLEGTHWSGFRPDLIGRLTSEA